MALQFDYDGASDGQRRFAGLLSKIASRLFRRSADIETANDNTKAGDEPAARPGRPKLRLRHIFENGQFVRSFWERES
jgi:hypothetical protein